MLYLLIQDGDFADDAGETVWTKQLQLQLLLWVRLQFQQRL
jgi:hypothetical protein